MLDNVMSVVAEKAALQLLVARSLFTYRISYLRGPWRIRISHVTYSRIAIAFARPIVYSHIAYHIRAAHSVFAYRVSHSRGP